MRTTTSVSTPSVPLVTSRLATPPPSPMLDLLDLLDLLDGESVVGWIRGTAIGFRGFRDEAEAAHAAWAAYRTMSRRFARESGRRPLPIDTERMALDRRGDTERILASGRPIATLVRPGDGGRSGPESFGFELEVPMPANELRMRSTAYLIYRTLRRSGIRWAMWAPPSDAAPVRREARTEEPGPATASLTSSLSRRVGDAAAAPALADGASGILVTALIVLAVLAVIILPAITTSTVPHLLGGAAALLALVAVASLVRVVVTNVRDSVRARERPSRSAHLDPSAPRTPPGAGVDRGRARAHAQ